MAVMEDPVWNSAGYECLCDGDYFDWLLTCLLYDWYVLNSFIFPGMCYVSKFRRRSKCEACRPASVHSHNTHSAPMNAFFIVCLLLNLLWLQSVSTQVTLSVSPYSSSHVSFEWYLLWIAGGSTDLLQILYSPCTRHSGDAPVPSAIFPGHTEYGQEKQ